MSLSLADLFAAYARREPFTDAEQAQYEEAFLAFGLSAEVTRVAIDEWIRTQEARPTVEALAALAEQLAYIEDLFGRTEGVRPTVEALAALARPFVHELPRRRRARRDHRRSARDLRLRA